jgi:hypothetical protein
VGSRAPGPVDTRSGSPADSGLGVGPRRRRGSTSAPAPTLFDPG